MKRTFVLVIGVLLACSSAVALASTAGRPAKAHAAKIYTLNLVKTKRGKILANTSGSFLYEFSKDPKNKDTCVKIKGCDGVWVPMPTTGDDTAGPGVKKSLISSIELKSLGYKQITYAGHPLYIFEPSPTSVSTIGTKSDGGAWYALDGKGHAVK